MCWCAVKKLLTHSLIPSPIHACVWHSALYRLLIADSTVWQCLFHFCWRCYELKTVIYTVSQKAVQNCFCQNFFKFPPLLIIFGSKMAKRLKLCEMRSFFTSANLHHHTTALNAGVPSTFNMRMWWRELGEMEIECTSHNFSLFSIFVPKIAKIGGNLTEFWQKEICTVFSQTLYL